MTQISRRPRVLKELLDTATDLAGHGVMSKSDMAKIRTLCRSDELQALKAASIARTIADANAAFKAGTLKQLTPSSAPSRHLRVRTPIEILGSVTRPVPEAQVRAYVASNYPGKEQSDFEPLTDAQYAVLERAASKKHGKVISSIIDKLSVPAGGHRTVTAKAFAVLPEFTQVRIECPDGMRFAITAKTPGIDWATLRVGQLIECTVTTTALPRVIEARIWKE